MAFLFPSLLPTPEYHPEIAAEVELYGAWFLPQSGEGTWVQCHHAPTEPAFPPDGVAGRSEALSRSLLTLTPPFQVERNLLLEEKVKTLQQENEDLQVRTQNHLVMAR